MEGIMKELGKCRAVIALLCFTATVFSGCGNRTEAVITDGEDITTVSAEYPTLEESHADIFTYKDLKIGNISYLMTESQVIAILGKPKEETENDGEKIYSYNEMSIGFEKLDDNNRPSGSGVYKVTQAASIGSDDKFSRNMRVGQSAGCVRFQCGNAYWIYNLVNAGKLRQVTIYNSSDYGPYGLPYVAPIPGSQTWDPTDPLI